jgi:hypothetical protein
MGTNYYVSTPSCTNACEHCDQSQRVHLGKSSGGWRFHFRAYPEWPREEAFQHWLALAGSGPIEDQYGKPWTLDALLAKIHDKQDGRSRLAPQRDLGYHGPLDGEFASAEGHEFMCRSFS